VTSPDGKYLAYTDSTGMYLKLIRAGEIHALVSGWISHACHKGGTTGQTKLAEHFGFWGSLSSLTDRIADRFCARYGGVEK
jgi:hypothetical protein